MKGLINLKIASATFGIGGGDCLPPWLRAWTTKWPDIANAVFRIVKNHGE